MNEKEPWPVIVPDRTVERFLFMVVKLANPLLRFPQQMLTPMRFLRQMDAPHELGSPEYGSERDQRSAIDRCIRDRFHRGALELEFPPTKLAASACDQRGDRRVVDLV
ncbi:hypothetical protein [Rhizobium binxianense]|uniref:hypothetical protein n=1 Tax=Rhizobium binxianense TaxID=3024242 RepID=UPI003D2F4840